MKKITILTLLVLICTSIFSQEFMGIKVGGKLNDGVKIQSQRLCFTKK